MAPTLNLHPVPLNPKPDPFYPVDLRTQGANPHRPRRCRAPREGRGCWVQFKRRWVQGFGFGV